MLSFGATEVGPENKESPANRQTQHEHSANGPTPLGPSRKRGYVLHLLYEESIDFLLDSLETFFHLVGVNLDGPDSF